MNTVGTIERRPPYIAITTKVLHMRNQIRVDPDSRAMRWVSYFDVLGFKELVRTEDWIHVFSIFSRAVMLATKDLGFDEPRIEKTWFSDTFLLYSSDNTKSSFIEIDLTTRSFISDLILAGIPVRGAMACGDFYADKHNNVFFGQALIEAYNYGENQNWIGFVLSPSADEQLTEVGLPANKMPSKYARWNIPCGKLDPGSLPAFIIGASGKTNGRNPWLDKLSEMKNRLNDSRIIEKYENTISFIEQMKGL